jgi:type 1 glutamine amidotransferase
VTTALILSGAGRYADPWHRFDETSRCLADLLEQCGVTVSITEGVDDAMTRLAGVDLLVVNAGDSSRSPAPAPDLTTARAGFTAALERGIAVLGTHTAAASLIDYPEWEPVLGGRWLPEVSMHPPIGPARIRVHPHRHVIVAGMADFETYDFETYDFETYDERYSHLRVAADVVPLASHTHDDVEHPLFWARSFGASRVVYSALGHDARAYESAALRDLLGRAVRWLTEPHTSPGEATRR